MKTNLQNTLQMKTPARLLVRTGVKACSGGGAVGKSATANIDWPEAAVKGLGHLKLSLSSYPGGSDND